ncbi:transposase [Streptomyces hirsutus]|uniref:transposase n=1 Tax=Streptomyces hirsutus TaxID=35620 RepID=UPI0033C56674
MGSKSNRSRRYTEEFKRDAVALVRSSGRTVTGVARELGVSAEGAAQLGQAGPGRSGPGGTGRADDGRAGGAAPTAQAGP